MAQANATTEGWQGVGGTDVRGEERRVGGTEGRSDPKTYLPQQGQPDSVAGTEGAPKEAM
jgi:hypothetical protein